MGLAGFGVAFLFLGILLLFDKGLLAIGNVGKNFPFTLRTHYLNDAKLFISDFIHMWVSLCNWT